MKQKLKTAKLVRDQINKKTIAIAQIGITVPTKGWIRAIRESIYMSQSQLAKRLKITRQALNRIERSEVTGFVEVATLQRVALALNCSLKYAFIPNENLNQFIDKQAIKKAKKIINETEKHMRLEDQSTNKSFQENSINELAEEIKENGKKLWSEDDNE